MKIYDIEKKIFQELGKEEKLLEYHNIIYQLIGVVIDYVNIEERSMNLLPIEHLNKYCAMFQKNRQKSNPCAACTKSVVEKAKRLKHVIIYKCHAQLNDLLLPLFDDKGNYVGAMTAGQFFIKGEPKVSAAKIAEIAQLNNLDANELYASYLKSPVLEERQLEGLISYLKNIGEIIIENRNKLLFWEKSNSTERINLIKNYIHKNYMHELNVNDIAKRFFLSPNHFCRNFKKRTGVSFVTYLNLYRINKSEELLKNTDLGLVEIAFQCGFGSVSQFYRYFKQIKNLSPQQFRTTAKAPDKA